MMRSPDGYGQLSRIDRTPGLTDGTGKRNTVTRRYFLHVDTSQVATAVLFAYSFITSFSRISD